MPWPDHSRLLPVRRRSRIADTILGTYSGFSRHQSGRNAGVMAYYGFLSLFPLVLVFTTILGFVLEDRPKLQADIVNSSLSHIPIIGPELKSDPAALDGKWWVLVFGLIAALWAGMRMFVGLQGALNDTAEIPSDKRLNFFVTRLRALVAVGVIGVAFIVTSTVSATAERGLHGIAATLGVLLPTALISAGVCAFAYRYLCAKPLRWNEVWPGAVFVGIVFAGLQLLVVRLASRAFTNADPVYGGFAGVIALFSWLSTHATVTLLGAELNHYRSARQEQAEL